MNKMAAGVSLVLLMGVSLATRASLTEESKKIGPLPPEAKLSLDEDWSSGKIQPKRWYGLRKKWGENNFGVVPENLNIVRDTVDGKRRWVLRCEAHGDDDTPEP